MKLKYIFLRILLLLFILFLGQQTSLQPSDIQIIGQQNKKIYLPYFSNSVVNSNVNFTGYLFVRNIHQNYIKLFVDNCLQKFTVNGIVVTPINKVDLCSGKDILFDLTKIVRPGKNYFTITIKNYDGPFGLNIGNSLLDPILIFFYFLCTVLLTETLFMIMTKLLKWKPSTTIILLIGILLRLIYLSQTPFYLRSYDASGHLEYIQYIVNNLRLPIYNQGWEFYHPPLYYIIGAVFYKLSLLFATDYTIVLQLLSLVFFIGLLVIFYKIITVFIESLFLKNLAFAMVVFFPSGIIHSIRISNDGLQYLTITLSFLLLLKWDKTKNLNMLYASLIFFIVSMLSKTTAIIFLPLYFFPFFHDVSITNFHIKKHIRKILLSLTIILISLFIMFYNNIFQKQQNYFVANITNLNSALIVGKNPLNFLLFDWNSYMNNNYISPWNDATGRQYFWNYLFKTSLFGEFEFNLTYQKNLAQILSLIFVLVIVYLIVGTIIQRKDEIIKNKYLILFLLSQLVFIILGRIILPYSCTNDFRYIFPSILSITILYLSAIIKFKQQKLVIIEYAGYLILCLFIISSVAFFLFPL